MCRPSPAAVSAQQSGCCVGATFLKKVISDTLCFDVIHMIRSCSRALALSVLRPKMVWQEDYKEAAPPAAAVLTSRSMIMQRTTSKVGFLVSGLSQPGDQRQTEEAMHCVVMR